MSSQSRRLQPDQQTQQPQQQPTDTTHSLIQAPRHPVFPQHQWDFFSAEIDYTSSPSDAAIATASGDVSAPGPDLHCPHPSQPSHLSALGPTLRKRPSDANLFRSSPASNGLGTTDSQVVEQPSRKRGKNKNGSYVGEFPPCPSC